MSLLPRSLFGRLALLLISLTLACQLFTLGMLRYSHQRLESRQLAEQVIDTLAELESALQGFSADERVAFLTLRNRPYSINLQPLDEVMPPAPGTELSPAAERLIDRLHEYGIHVVDARMQIQPKQQLWLPIRMVGERYWLVIPLGSTEPPMGSTTLLLSATFSLLALAAAFAFTWLINRPLQRLTRSAATVAAGKHPEPLPEDGPRELHTLAASFNHMTGALQQAEQERRIMLAGISHDVRTPLTRLRLGVEMMQDESLRAGMLTDTEDIERIVRQFHDFIAGEPDEPASPQQLNRLILAMVERYQRDGLEIATELADDLAPLTLKPLALQRVLGNLIDNARRYGQPPIVIRSLQQADTVCLQVIDHGAGIAAADIERMQQPFTRGDAARQADGGSGLGLAIVRRICQRNAIALNYSRPQHGGLCVELSLKTSS
ncbi:MAG: ATP-binding protein [Chitinivorax sp.]